MILGIMIVIFIMGVLAGSVLTHLVCVPRNAGVLIISTANANDDLLSLELHQNINDLYKQNHVVLDVRRK